ncbi:MULTISPECIES: 4a-hydroxytetrahydrobiopterin dehydratase [Actinomadura]|uniref:Putative pterin-4-alpha-carbinolamine dehydratase n=2 Tax=Actinomadura TaxID=1988 RepID=A0A2P4UC40_9ACTN|nr:MULTISPECIES: 4a-hydroxytetrahydrobiopterin dehydratase [Actinomadura]MXQ67273.1 4a-hydroxytetrahydrobiopterin dehydratase [Actinomadura rayongensis]POM22606.1 putative pterin-4-alpha-carbinolamine dehydratase [Actinomadura rubteroloni]
MAEVLGDAAIAARLTELAGWERTDGRIHRSVTAPSFLTGIEVVNEVARAAETADHHPDIDIRWRTVTFSLTTHSAGGLTAKDFALAESIDRIAAQHDAT